jgi:hypothetical protein
MDTSLVRRLWVVGRAVVIVFTLFLLLLQAYGLYFAAAVAPRQPWRRRIDYHLRRALIAMDHLHLTPQE